ncbi:MAG: SRPBCC domain-containing protein [Planctomycetota bacterium]
MTTPQTPGNATDFQISRVFDAPRELVYRTWTDPVHLARWWGPRIMTAWCNADVRPGGRYRLVMVDPAGGEYPMTGVYQEVVTNERLVFTMDLSEHSAEWHDLVNPDRDRSAGIPSLDLVCTVTFSDAGEADGKTLCDIRVSMHSAAMRDRMVKMGMQQGWSESLDKLGELADTIDREIVTVRDFDFPRELVFKAWTAPEHLAKWWGPNGFSITTHSMDFAPGGEWRLTMHGPDGTDYPNRIIFHKIVTPSRLEYSHANDEVEGVHVHFSTTVTFHDLGGRTRLTMRAVFPTAEQLRFVAENYGAIEGAKQTVGRLAEYVPQFRHKLVITLPSPTEAVLTRVFDAPRHLVFEAMTKPEHVRRWWGVFGGTQMIQCDLDLRVGGNWRYVLRAQDGTEMPFAGTYKEIVPPARIVQTERYDIEPFSQYEYVATMTLTEDARGRTVMRTHLQYPSPEARDGHLGSGMEGGANLTMELLETLLAELGHVDPGVEFTIDREVDAPRQLVYEAWTDPAHLVKWWGPKGFALDVASIDVRPGGGFHYKMTSGQQVMWGRFTYLDVVPGERLVYVVSFSDPEGRIVRAPMSETWPMEMLNTLTLDDLDGRTRMQLRSVPVRASQAEVDTFVAGHASMNGGFGATFDALVVFLADLNRGGQS